MTEQGQILKELDGLIERAAKAGMKVSRTIGFGEPLSMSLDGARWSTFATIRLEWEPRNNVAERDGL